VSPLGPDYPAAGLKRDASLPFADKNSLSRRIAEYTLSPLSFKAWKEIYFLNLHLSFVYLKALLPASGFVIEHGNHSPASLLFPGPETLAEEGLLLSPSDPHVPSALPKLAYFGYHG